MTTPAGKVQQSFNKGHFFLWDAVNRGLNAEVLECKTNSRRRYWACILLALVRPPAPCRTCPCLSSRWSAVLFLPSRWTHVFVLPADVFRPSSGYSAALPTCSQRIVFGVCVRVSVYLVSLSHINTFQSRSSSPRFLLTAVPPPPLARPPLQRPLTFFFLSFSPCQ